MKYVYFFLFIKIILIYSSIPNWNLESVSVNLYSANSEKDEYPYVLYNNDKYLLKKIITKYGDKMKSRNYLTYDGNYGRDVDFERFESKYWNQLEAGKLICPKGSFHPYDFDNNKYIKPFTTEGIWELSCYEHKTGYFIMFYAHNGENSVYYTKGNNNNIKHFDSIKGLYSYKLLNIQILTKL